MSFQKPYNQAEFDFTGEQLRDTGIQLATDHADSKVKDWTKLTYGLFKDFLKEQREPFLLEEFRSWLALRDDYIFPDNLKAFGWIPPKAAREKLIKQVGTRKVKNAKAHCANAALWKKV